MNHVNHGLVNNMYNASFLVKNGGVKLSLYNPF